MKHSLNSFAAIPSVVNNIPKSVHTHVFLENHFSIVFGLAVFIYIEMTVKQDNANKQPLYM